MIAATLSERSFLIIQLVIGVEREFLDGAAAPPGAEEAPALPIVDQRQRQLLRPRVVAGVVPFTTEMRKEVRRVTR